MPKAPDVWTVTVPRETCLFRCAVAAFIGALPASPSAPWYAPPKTASRALGENGVILSAAKLAFFARENPRQSSPSTPCRPSARGPSSSTRRRRTRRRAPVRACSRGSKTSTRSHAFSQPRRRSATPPPARSRPRRPRRHRTRSRRRRSTSSWATCRRPRRRRPRRCRARPRSSRPSCTPRSTCRARSAASARARSSTRSCASSPRTRRSLPFRAGGTSADQVTLIVVCLSTALYDAIAVALGWQHRNAALRRPGTQYSRESGIFLQ